MVPESPDEVEETNERSLQALQPATADDPDAVVHKSASSARLDARLGLAEPFNCKFTREFLHDCLERATTSHPSCPAQTVNRRYRLGQ